MVLRSDLYSDGSALQYRLIRTAMTKLELERLCTTCKRQQLVAQADTEDRLFAKHIANRVLSVGQRLWIPRAIAQKHSIRIKR